LEPHCHDLFLALVGLAPFRSGWVGRTSECAAAGGIALLAIELFLVVVDNVIVVNNVILRKRVIFLNDR